MPVEMIGWVAPRVASEIIPPQGPAFNAEVIATSAKIHEAADFDRVLTQLEDPRLKNWLVKIDERAHAKASAAGEDAASRLSGLIRDFRRKTEEASLRGKHSALQEGHLSEHEQRTTLQELFDRERDRQGLSAPTDG